MLIEQMNMKTKVYFIPNYKTWKHAPSCTN